MAKRGDGLEELAYQIVASCCEDYRQAYIKGNVNELLKCKAFLLSGRVEIYTLYSFYGEEILKTMNDDLFAKYGSFESSHKAKTSSYQEKIDNKTKQLQLTREEIKDTLADTKLPKEESNRILGVLRRKRNRLIGEINRLKKEAKE